MTVPFSANTLIIAFKLKVLLAWVNKFNIHVCVLNVHVVFLELYKNLTDHLNNKSLKKTLRHINIHTMLQGAKYTGGKFANAKACNKTRKEGIQCYTTSTGMACFPVSFILPKSIHLTLS